MAPHYGTWFCNIYKREERKGGNTYDIRKNLRLWWLLDSCRWLAVSISHSTSPQERWLLAVWWRIHSRNKREDFGKERTTWAAILNCLGIACKGSLWARCHGAPSPPRPIFASHWSSVIVASWPSLALNSSEAYTSQIWWSYRFLIEGLICKWTITRKSEHQ